MKAWLIPEMIAQRVVKADEVFQSSAERVYELFNFESSEPVEVCPCLITKTDGVYEVKQGTLIALLPLNCLILIA
jgi:hypothetical protein